MRRLRQMVACFLHNRQSGPVDVRPGVDLSALPPEATSERVCHHVHQSGCWQGNSLNTPGNGFGRFYKERLNVSPLRR